MKIITLLNVFDEKSNSKGGWEEGVRKRRGNTEHLCTFYTEYVLSFTIGRIER